MIHEGVAIAEENIGDTLLLGDLPHPLLVIEVGSILGKPKDPDVLSDLRMIQERHRLLRGVDRAVVQGEDDALPSLPGVNDEPAYKEDELGAILASLGHARHQGAVFSGGVVNRSEGRDLAVLTGRWDRQLLASTHPRARQVRVKMEVGFIFEPELESRSTTKSPFFKA